MNETIIVSFEVFGSPQQKGSLIPGRTKKGKLFTRPGTAPKSPY